MRHIFIIGAKSIGQYGGYESFLDKLTEQHKTERGIQYYIVTKSNGDGCMDETKLTNVSCVRRSKDGKVISFKYNNANVLKLSVPQIGVGQAVIHDIRAMKWCISYIKRHHIKNPIIYVLACRIGPFFKSLTAKAHDLGVKIYVNPDGHEWKRSKWSMLVRKYWKESERLMVKYSDLLICDSINMKKYIDTEYKKYSPNSIYISYGADVEKSIIKDDDPEFVEWLISHNLRTKDYYMCCGRFVPENNYEVMIREFMKSKTEKDFVIITTQNEKYADYLEEKYHWKRDKRIKFVGTVYDKELLKKIRENAYANIHGHTVGGTNPSLLEALASTDLNLLVDVSFNREVAEDASYYWECDEGYLSRLIDRCEKMSQDNVYKLGKMAKQRIIDSYSWNFIGDEYKKLWNKK